MDTLTLPVHDSRYPTRLRNTIIQTGGGRYPIKERPIGTLYAKGDLALVDRPTVAIIGTRHPTPTGVKRCQMITRHFAELGYTIVSGLADGIDKTAHRAAIECGGKTIAVLGFPLWEKHWPPQSQSERDLIEQSIDHNLLITEYNTQARGGIRFIERDCIQAALSIIVIPIEAGIGSGTLHTLGAAQRMGIPIWIPASVQSEYAACTQRAGLEPLLASGAARSFTSADYPEMEKYLNESCK